MYPKTITLLRHFLAAIAIFATVIGWSSPSDAYVQKIIIDQQISLNFTPIMLGTSTPGPLTPYTIYTGRIFGELDPSDPQHSIITDIEHAPKTQGKVTYVANFQIVTPTDPQQRNGLLIHEVPNRGNNAIPTTALEQGATYVQSGWQGDLLAQCSPSLAIPYPCFDLNSGPYGSLNTTTGALVPPNVPDVAGTPTTPGMKPLASYVVQVPVATHGNSSNNGNGQHDGDDHGAGGNIITGQVYGHVCSGTNGCGLPVPTGTPPGTAQLVIQGPAFVPYHPASLDTKQAQFWSVSSQTAAGVTSVKTPIPSGQWAWAYCPNGWPGTPNPNWICLKNGTFNPKLEYEMVYTAENPLVLGVGFVAFRDLAAFLRYGTNAPGGGSNPIAGSITKAMTVGASQSAAFIHGFIFWGFNEEGRDQWGHDQRGRIVFDGAWPQIDGRMMVMNIRFGQPNNLMYLYMGGDEAPVWWANYPNLARHLPSDGMLHRCAQDNTCPAILETFASAELYSEKMSVSLCGFTCVQDISIPSNIYRYYTPGATHGGGAVSPSVNLFNWVSPAAVNVPAGQSLANDPVPLAYTNNALQYNFIQLLVNAVAMPPSVYPTLSKGQLVPNTKEGVGFPDIPGLPYGGNQAWPPFVYNFGPKENYDQESGVPTIQPPIIEKVLPVYAAKVNADGNEVVDGMPTVLGEAPLGTYVGWNLATTGWYGPNASNGPGSVGQVFAGAGNSGGYYPFWDTKANRQAIGDPRLSLEERYGTHAGYVCVVTAAVNRAQQRRFLLPSDAQTLISQVNTSNVLVANTATPADTALANSLCSH